MWDGSDWSGHWTTRARALSSRHSQPSPERQANAKKLMGCKASIATMPGHTKHGKAFDASQSWATHTSSPVGPPGWARNLRKMAANEQLQRWIVPGSTSI